MLKDDDVDVATVSLVQLNSLTRSAAATSAAAMTMDPDKTRSILQLTLQLMEVVFLAGHVKLPPIEAKLSMEPGGALRQGLRLGTA